MEVQDETNNQESIINKKSNNAVLVLKIIQC